MHRKYLCALLLSVLGVSEAHASVIDLTFEGLKNLETIGNFYNGGQGGSGSGPGPADGITFSPNALAIISDQAGGGGNFDRNAPSSGDTIMFFLNGPSAFLDDAAGFQNGFGVYYSAINNPGSLSVYSGLDGTGTLLGTLALPTTPANPAGRFQPFVPVGLKFLGTAESISFAGVENQIGFDDVTFGSSVPGSVPVAEPASIAMVSTAGLMVLLARRRRGPSADRAA